MHKDRRRHAALAVASLAAFLLTTPVFRYAAAAEPSEVQRGEYLARVGDCLSCHTAPSGAAFAGGNRLNTPFGYMLTSNITPDPDTGIGHWTADLFYRALHDGVNAHGEDMYPTMPYDFYTKASRKDIDAIYAYLQTVQPVKNAVDVNHLRFPFNQRWSMAAWRELYFSEGGYQPDTAMSASWNRGAYLVEGLGHCSACHSPRNLLGGIDKKKEYTGALNDGWFGVDLTSDLPTGLGSWSIDEIAIYLKTGAAIGKATAFGPMREYVQTSTGHLNDDDLRAMSEYLKSIPAASRLRTVARQGDTGAQQGATLYLDNCGGCHQARGRGISGVVPPLAGNGSVVAADPSDVINVVLGGSPKHGDYTAMPPFATSLNDVQIAQITNYLRTSWGNSAQANATAASVAKLRVPAK
jgi:mono/diheme cytochrome c family protein